MHLYHFTTIPFFIIIFGGFSTLFIKPATMAAGRKCADLLVSNFKGFEKTNCSCYRGRWSNHEANGLEKSA